MALDFPVSATDHSASSKFFNPETAWPVNFKFKALEDDNYSKWKHQHWADADINHAAWLMLEVLNNSSELNRRTSNAKKLIDELFNLDNSKNKMLNRLKLITS